MKIALCFIISYEHILNKENIWREWIEPNKDIINVYFYYKDIRKIKSEWILQHTIPSNHIVETSYYFVIPAYLSIMQFAFNHDNQNKWFCMLTDSCCPIISPNRFRYLFYKHHKKSIFSWKVAWWNPDFHKRANLAKLPKKLWLANDPWFTLTRDNVEQVISFVKTQKSLTKTICDGGLANESLFAIILKLYKALDNNTICSPSHITDWNRMSSATSPHIFKIADDEDKKFIDKELERNKYAMFIRKVAKEFPDDVLRHYIYEKNMEEDSRLVLSDSEEIIRKRVKHLFFEICILSLFLVGLYIIYLFVYSAYVIFLF